MSITTYTELQTAMTNWLGNSLNSTIYPDFITLFEAAANRRLRVRQQITSAALTFSSGNATLPTDYLTWRRVTRTDTLPQDVEYVEPSYLQTVYPDQVQTVYPPANAVPAAFFTIEGTTIKIRPIADSASTELLYYAKIPALASNSTNWLLSAYPDVYLFGSLAEAEMYAVNDQRAATWAARRDALFDEIIALNMQQKAPSAVRVIGPTP